MSVLIDDLIKTTDVNCNEEINGKWYIAEPCRYLSFKDRLKDAIRVLQGKSYAIHYARTGVMDD